MPYRLLRVAGQAFVQALHLADQFGAELHTLHAIVLHEADPYNPAFHFPDADEIWQRLSEIASAEMTGLMQCYPQETPVKVHRAQERGIAAAPVILDYAQAHDIDLIVMSTHGRRGPSRFFLGSVTEEVMRSAECPVFTLRERAEMVSAKAVQVVIAPVDFSEHSRSALAFARELAQIYEAQLHIKHIIEGRHHPEYLRAIGDVYEAQPEIVDLLSAVLAERLAATDEALEQKQELSQSRTGIEERDPTTFVRHIRAFFRLGSSS